MRLFVAVYPPAEARSDLRRRLDALLPDTVRLTPADRWHLTLAFLGDVEDVPPVEAAISRAVTGFAPIRLRLAGAGSFGRSRAVWAGVSGDLAALYDLHAALQRSLVEAGVEHDPRPLTPHLTVTYRGDRAVREALRSYTGPEWTASEVVLVRSWFPQAGGYETLQAWPIHDKDS